MDHSPYTCRSMYIEGQLSHLTRCGSSQHVNLYIPYRPPRQMPSGGVPARSASILFSKYGSARFHTPSVSICAYGGSLGPLDLSCLVAPSLRAHEVKRMRHLVLLRWAVGETVESGRLFAACRWDLVGTAHCPCLSIGMTVAARTEWEQNGTRWTLLLELVLVSERQV